MPEFKHQRSLTLFLLGCVLVIALAFWWLAERSPNITYLAAHPPACWILYPTKADGTGLPAVELSSEFHRSFQLENPPSVAVLSVRAFKSGRIVINGKALAPGINPAKNWKDASDFNVAPLLQPGTNEISVTVYNDYGPPALWLSLSTDSVSLISDEAWQVSYAGAAWQPARLAGTPLRIGIGSELSGGQTLGAALGREWTRLLLFAALTGLLLLAGRWWLNHYGEHLGWPPLFAPDRWPILALAALAFAWALLWANNVALLPPQTGFDIASHLDYVNYILKNHRLPLPNEGFEMYQPPLYYVIAAGLLTLCHSNALDPNGMIILRIFGLFCGIGTFTLVFASARLIFPGQPRKQFFALLLAALLPANVYIFQYATNELLATTMAALVAYLCLRILANPQLSPAQHAGLGLALGGALLTKTSTVVLPPVVAAALVWNLWTKSDRRAGKWASCLGMTFLVCAASAGWHYARIAAHFGNPLLGNWDAASGFHWWQQAGYRTSSYYFHFGRSLTAPLFSSFGGFADGVYSTLWGDGLYGGIVEFMFRPPWNYDLMVAGYPLALLPTLAIFLGAAILVFGFIRKPDSSVFLVLGLTALLALLLFYYSFKVPVYASNKAFYASAALIPVCLLGAAGWNFLCQRAGGCRVVLYLLLGVWAMTAYFAFWIQKNAPHTEGLVARGFTDAGRPELAVTRLTQLLQEHPHNPQLTVFLLLELIAQNRMAEAKMLAQDALAFDDANADLHLLLGTTLAEQGQFEAAAEQARHAIQLSPDHYSAEQRLAEWLESAGHETEAVTAAREGLRISPANGKLHYLLGTLLADLGDTTNALAQFRFATELEPDLAAAHERLGLMLMDRGQADDAIPQFGAVIRLNPEDARNWCYAAQAFARRNDLSTAIKYYRHAIELDPKCTLALGDLAWQLATQRNPKIRNGAEALQLATRACQLSNRRNASYLQILSAADAETGRFDEAITNANAAIAIAGSNGEKDVAESCRNLIQLYQSRRPYRQERAKIQTPSP